MELQNEPLINLPKTKQETKDFVMKVYKNSLPFIASAKIVIPGSTLIALTEIVARQVIDELIRKVRS